jgi:GNAT superfamily N-acetyltransferase
MHEEIRAAPLDGGDASMLVAAFTDEIVDRYPTWTPASGPSAHPTEFIPPDGLFVVAYRDGAPVGCAGFKRIEQQRAEIKRLYVSPDGRRGGLARRILERLETAAREAGFIAVRLDTGNQQPEALALFRSTGYREIDDYNANPFASYWFEKPL